MKLISIPPKRAVVVLGHRLEDNGRPTEELRSRLALGIELFEKIGADRIIFSGGMANSRAGITEAKIMGDHAILKGIPQHKIILEEKSLDTIDNAIFTKEVVKGKFKELYIITSCYHVSRASFIFKMVFGEKYRLHFDYCSRVGEGEEEKAQLNKAKQFFKDMNPGDDKELRKRILRYELYIKEG